MASDGTIASNRGARARIIEEHVAHPRPFRQINDVSPERPTSVLEHSKEKHAQSSSEHRRLPQRAGIAKILPGPMTAILSV